METVMVFYDNGLTVEFQNSFDICIDEMGWFCFTNEKDGMRFRNYIPPRHLMRVAVKEGPNRGQR